MQCRRWEIDPGRLTLSDCIGAGNTGRVWRAELAFPEKFAGA